MIVLVLNCGSSSLKFQLIETDQGMIEADSDRALVRGTIERIGSMSLISMSFHDGSKLTDTKPLRNHSAGVDFVLKTLVANADRSGIGSLGDIDAAGHRVVHGGERFTSSVLLTPEVLDEIEETVELAPLHNPANLRGIASVTENLGDGLPQVAVFDTSFHTSMAPEAYLYAIPYQLYRRHKIRRYGFHGTSHRYVAMSYRRHLGLEREQTNVVTIHLGNGCSACAVEGGVSVDTSMGFTPLEGLVMGTRSGDIDASILEYLSHKEGLSFDQLDILLNKQSGLLGISGLTNDMRDLLEEVAETDDRRARLALDMFTRRVKKYIGSYVAVMDQCDAVVFTGGIGENSSLVRSEILSGLDRIGFSLDHSLNEADESGLRSIASEDSTHGIYVIPTNEELLIARDTVRCIEDLPRRF